MSETRVLRAGPGCEIRISPDLSEEERMVCEGQATEYRTYYLQRRWDFWRSKFASPIAVYFVGEGEFVWSPSVIKIGVAADPWGRLAELQCGNPDPLTIAGLVLGSAELERRIHKRWAEARVRGEWFGRGYVEAILALAEETAKQQRLAQLRGGYASHYLTEGVPEHVGLA